MAVQFEQRVQVGVRVKLGETGVIGVGVRQAGDGRGRQLGADECDGLPVREMPQPADEIGGGRGVLPLVGPAECGRAECQQLAP